MSKLLFFLFLLLLFMVSGFAVTDKDHDTITQVQQNVLFNNRRLDDHDKQIQANVERMTSLENEFSNIRGIGEAVLAVGGIQIILSLVGLRKKGNGHG